MKRISVIIGEKTRYSVDLKDEYQAEEFIDFFEEQIQIIKKILPRASNNLSKFAEVHTTYKTNALFNELDTMIKGLGSDIEVKENASMRTYTSIVKSKNKRRGLVWLKPIGNSLIIHFRTIDYSDVDKKGKITYSTPEKKTLGRYPTFTINERSDLEYSLRIIKHAYTSA